MFRKCKNIQWIWTSTVRWMMLNSVSYFRARNPSLNYDINRNTRSSVFYTSNEGQHFDISSYISVIILLGLRRTEAVLFTLQALFSGEDVCVTKRYNDMIVPNTSHFGYILPCIAFPNHPILKHSNLLLLTTNY